MHFFFEVVVPRGTVEESPYEETLRLTSGVITSVLVYIPRGHVGLAHLQLLYHEHQLYPLNTGGSYRGNETTIGFTEYQPVTVSPYELKARAWNLDDTFDHAFLVGLAMQRPEEMGMEIPAVSLEALNSLIGQAIPEG